MKSGNGLMLHDDHALSDEESESFGNAGTKSAAVMEGDISERTVSDPRPSQKGKIHMLKRNKRF